MLPVVNLARLTIGIANSEGVHKWATGLSRLATNRDNKNQDLSIIVQYPHSSTGGSTGDGWLTVESRTDQRHTA